MINSNKADGKFMGSVKVGTKGQIVIPKEVREMFSIKPGDTLLLLADGQKGIAIEKMEVFNRIADAILEGRTKVIYPELNEREGLIFAKEVKKLHEKEGS